MSRPVYQVLTMNQPVAFSVNFTGRQSHDLTVRWSKDGQPVEDGVHNSFDDALAIGRTVLSLPQARRSDAGVYHVIISSQVGEEGEPPAFSSQQQASFQINITGKEFNW